MRRRSFFTLVLGSNLLLIGGILAIGSMFALRQTDEQLTAQSVRFQRQVLATIVAYFERNWPLTPEEVSYVCRTQFAGFEYRLTIIDPSGIVLGDTHFDPLAMEPHNTPDRPEVLGAIDGHFGENTRRSETLGVGFRYFAEPVRYRDQVVAIARVALPTENLERNQRLLSSAILWSFQMMLMAAVALTLLLSWLWYRPLRTITAVARDIALGNLEQRPKVQGFWELEQLADALDRMRRTVSSQLETIRQQREGLRTILSNLREAIVAVDSTDQVVFLNKTARELFRVADEDDSCHVQSIFRQAAIVELYHRATDTDHPVQQRLDLDLHGRRYALEVDVTRVSGNGNHEINTLIVLRDMTDLLRTNEMKADFVANASHELRTPLATLRMALDTLADDPLDNPASIRRMVDILDRHTGRLEAMVNDLLDLHVVENESVQNRLELVELADLAQWLTSHFAQAAEEKEVDVRTRCEPVDDVFLIDRKRLSLIVQNLVDNAIKFTPRGGWVEVDFRRVGRQFEIQVRDNGCGIASADQPKVFDRFYQADSSRTGDNRIRGTGLGLAIVKHATERLGGKVQLESRVDVGTKVTVRVPVTFPAEKTA